MADIALDGASNESRHLLIPQLSNLLGEASKHHGLRSNFKSMLQGSQYQNLLSLSSTVNSNYLIDLAGLVMVNNKAQGSICALLAVLEPIIEFHFHVTFPRLTLVTLVRSYCFKEG